MMKKYYILVFKLLSLFLGQSSYAIGQGDYGYDDNYGTNWWDDVEAYFEYYGIDVEKYDNWSDYQEAHPEDFTELTDAEYENYLSEGTDSGICIGLHTQTNEGVEVHYVFDPLGDISFWNDSFWDDTSPSDPDDPFDNDQDNSLGDDTNNNDPPCTTSCTLQGFELKDCECVPIKLPCKTSAADLKAMFGPTLTDAKATQLADVLNKYAGKFGIDSKEKLQHFLAQAGYESDIFTTTKERTSYQVSVAKGIFNDLFKANGKNINDFGSYLNSKGIAYIDDKEAFFNFVYDDAVRGNARGWSKNGNTNPGDGYLYIGRGVIQLTGREKYTNFTNWYQININSNKNFVDNPALLDTDFEVGVIASLWFFKTFVIGSGLSIDAQTTSSQVTKKVNPKMLEQDKRDKNFKTAKTTIKCN